MNIRIYELDLQGIYQLKNILTVLAALKIAAAGLENK